MDKIIKTEGMRGRPLLCDHTGVSSKESQKHLTTPTSLEMLKNSHSRSPQKFHRARMPDKRRSRFWWTFSTPRRGQFFQNREFFNSHRRSHQLAPFVGQKTKVNE